jgi:serine/threonine protein kinase
MSSQDDEKTLPSITGYTKRSESRDDATRIKPLASNPDATQFHDKTVVRAASPSDSLETTAQEKPILKNRFILEEVLGSGGMGVVYKAKDMRRVENHDNEPYVAIKLLNEEFKRHPEAVTALQRESKKTQTIAHPNIVSVYDFDRDGQDVFMTMEYMDGKPLDKLIKQYSDGGLPPDDTRKILKSICAALIYAHGEKIIHSDLKPSNIFVNKRRNAKVFDFGIARAVAEAEHEEHQEHPGSKQTPPNIRKKPDSSASPNTIFDAGTLGALTPAYASLEMLRLEHPDVRDDVYALGCVAYEMFTGKHPFNKLPADQAYEKNLKPKTIKSIPKKEWLAIEAALQFKREERIASIQEFISAFNKQRKRPIKTVIASVITVASLSIWITYELLNKPAPEGPSKQDIRNELALEITLDLHKKNLGRLMARPLFTGAWQNQVWQEYKAIKELSPEDLQWVKITTDKILSLHLNEIEALSLKTQYQSAITLLNNSYRYTNNTQDLDAIKKDLETLLAKKQAKKIIPKITKKPVKPAIDQNTTVSPVRTKTTKESFALAEKNVHQHLECKTHINMRDFSAAIKKLASLNSTHYASIEESIIKKLSVCIKKQAEQEPERAIESKRIALRLFDSDPLIAAIKIAPRDHCDSSIAGLGARGKNTSCSDIVGNGKTGPRLVVIPAKAQIEEFAISKHEISHGDYNLFCHESGLCKPNESVAPELPLTGIDFSDAKIYIRWLTRSSGHKYRLPSRQEWLHSAKASNASLNPNRNCTLSSRGIQKGGKLVSTETGKGNSWGLVNSIGNAREWAYDKGRKLVAVGGSYKDPIESCTFSTVVNHSGKADKVTGFRVVRDIRKI